ncbi:MBG domain-containing protein [Flavobacterium sp. 120]|uniref:MBG domain-containing protein n=1 Tax=Flavobacterium sp. 120 TaxID=2135626 RepID=UPI000EAEA9E1|nr:MBG domain-containing protein [Flavobacterium sp. 120]RKS14668.1 putative secreted protein (Por secretion system target) [Flavobacterium sp. 120]
MKTFLLKSHFLTIVFLAANLFFASVAFGQATVTTDKDDYGPGEYVIITGTGWTPGETVTLHFDETPKPATCLLPHDMTTVADSSGNIYNNQFLIKINHIGVAFLLTATGQTSGLIATRNFTDANVNFSASGLSGTPTVKANYVIKSTITNATISSGSKTYIYPGPSLTPNVAVNSNQTIVANFEDILLNGVIYSAPSVSFSSGNNGNGVTTLNAAYSLAAKVDPIIIWNNPTDITYGTALSGVQLNATTSVEGTFVYTPPLATILNAGNNQALLVTFTPTNTANYNIATKTVNINILKASLSIIAEAKTKTYGDANPSFSAVVAGTVNNDILDYSLATTATQFSDVGDYPIAITLGLNPNYSVTPTNAVLTIGQKSATVIAEAKTKTYGDANPSFSAVVAGTVNNDILDYSLATTATQFSDVGDYPIAITLGLNPNYSVTPTNAVLTIGQKSATVIAEAKTKTYGDANPSFSAVVAGTVNNDILDYSLATTATQFSDVGDYPIAITLGLNPNYSVTPTNAVLTIGQKSATVIAEAKTKTYGDANPSFSAVVAGTVNNDILDYSLATTATQFSDVGDYPIAITLGLNPNYSVTPTNAVLTIGQKSATVIAEAKTKTYGDANPSFSAVVAGTVNNDILDYSLATTATQFSDVGDYPIAITLGLNPNYSVTPTNAVLTIGQKSATVIAEAKTKTYGDANPSFSAVVAGTVNNDILDYSLATTATQFSDVGDYPIAITLGLNPNYSVTPTNAVLTIGQKSATVIAEAKTKTYGDANPSFSAVVAGTVNNDILDYSLATTATQFSDVGDYPIAITLGLNPNYSVTPTNAVLTIGQKSATVIAEAKTKTYGDANPSFSAVVAGTVNNDILDYSLATTATQFSDVGDYPIAITLGLNPNYSVTPTNAVLTIGQKSATVIAEAKTKTYGDANPSFSAVVAGTVNNDILDYSLATTATQFSDVGDYPIAITLGLNPNYSVTPTNAVLTIGQKSATVIAEAKTKTYGDANPSFSAVVAGTVNNDILDYSLATTATQFSDVGDYPIAITLGLNPNYSVTPTNAVLTIGQKSATVIAEAKTKTYGDANPSFSAVVAGTVNNDILDYSLATTATQFSDVGDYPIAITLGLNPNYSVTPTNAVLTIGQKSATVIAEAKTKTYGDANPSFSAVVAGTVNNDILDYSLATTATQFSDVGDYPIAITLGLNPNYSVTPTNAVLTIGQKSATVIAEAKTKTYGDANPSFSAVVAGTVNNDILDYSLATTATQFSDVGDYPIAITLGLNPNYSVTPTNAVLTIGQKSATVIAEAKTKTYGDANPSFSAVVAGTVNNDILDYSLATTATQFSDVGDYPIAITLGLNPNYSVTPTNAVLTIGQKSATVIAEAKTKTYGDANPSFSAVVAGTVNNDILDYSLATTATQFSDVGDYPIAITLGLNPNYSVTPTNAVLTIGQKSATVIAEAKTKTYGDANPSFSAVVAGTVNNDILDYSLATTATQFSDVGDYPIAITLGLNPNYSVTPTNAVLTIGQKSATVIAEAKTKTYGDANPSFSAVVAGTVNNDILDYSLATTATQFSDVGDYPIAITLGLNPNYSVTPTNAVLTIGQKSATVIAEAKTKTYGDANPSFSAVVAGTVNNDILDYSLATTATQFSDVGDYPIAITLGLNPNYSVTPTNAVLTIGQKSATVIAEAKTKTYGDANPSFSAVVAGTVNNDILDYSLATTATQFSDVGDYPIAITLGLNPNYSVTPTNAVLTIGQKSATVIAEAKTKTYGDANPSFSAVVAGTVNNDILDYSLATTATQFSDVGDYPIAITLGLNPNYSVTPTNAVLTIGQKSATVIAEAKTKTYGDANPSFSAVVAGTVNNDILDYSLATTATQFSDVGDYPIAITLGLNPNYSVTPTNAVLTIGQKSATVIAEAKTKTYGDANPSFSAVVAGTVNNDILDYSLATTATQFSDVGDYPIAITLGLNPNYSVTPTNAVLTIGQKSATVIAEAKTKTYGDANPSFSAVVAGTVNNDILDYSLATTATQFSDVGDYPIAITLGLNPNYSVTPTNAVLTIGQKSATVIAEAKTKTYGDANPSFSAVVAGTVNNDILDYSLATTATQFSDVGDYPIAITLGLNPNYSVTPTNAVLTIGQKSATVIAEAKTKTYGDANPSFSAVVAGTVNNDILDYSLATTATQFSDVGDYPIAITLGLNPNYSVTPTNAVLTIGQKSATVIAEAKTKTYGDANPSFSAVVAGTVNNDILDYSLATTATQFSDVGDYPIAITLGLNPNYSVTPTNAVLTINKKLITITADDKSKYCGQMNPPLTVSIVGFVNEETIAVLNVLPIITTSADITSAVGDYVIKASGCADNNYSFNYIDGILKVNNVSIDASASNAPVALGTTATLSAIITPKVAGVSVSFYLDTVLKGTSSTNALGIATLGVTGLQTEVYQVKAIAGNGCADSSAYLAVYDPNGGFVTGGGWIMSPLGAYTANPTLTGKANFGFNAKYKKGNTQVDGNTEFQFQTGNLNFSSSSHEAMSLVIAGAQAIYKGQGTINGVPGYSFMVSAIDGEKKSTGVTDKFRIKIWNGAGVVYDNQIGAADNADATTAIGGGSIVIHEVKKNGAAKVVIVEKNPEIVPFAITAYPNPSAQYFIIDIKGGTSEKTEVIVYDILGRMVKHIQNSDSKEIKFGEELSSGSYIAIINQGTQQKTVRLIKQ